MTTIQLKKSVVKELKSIRKYPRETYNETILNLIKKAKETKNNQYDQFLHRIQQAKMKELWDNQEDEAPLSKEKKQAVFDGLNRRLEGLKG